MSMDEDEQRRNSSMIEFLGYFQEVSVPPVSLKDLSDGVVMFEALSEVAPDYFDINTISRDVGDNWALKSSNLRKLLRNLETYYREGLEMTADFEEMNNSIASISRECNEDSIIAVVELIVAASVMAEEKATFVGYMLNLDVEGQVHLKQCIEAGMARNSPIEDDSESESVEQGENELAEGKIIDVISDDEDDFEGGAEMTGLFRNAMENMDAALDTSFIGGSRSVISSGTTSNEYAKECEELKVALADAKRELATYKSQSAIIAEDAETSQKKLRALAEDFQDRLEKRETELNNMEEDLSKTKRALDDAETRTVDLSEKNAVLADELDVANAKAGQLRKAEATVLAYRRKLEGVGVMNQQMTDLEDQAAGYLRQIMDLEVENKKVPELQKNLDESKRDLGKLDKEKKELIENLDTKTAEVAKLKADLSASNAAKKMFEDEVNELRVVHQHSDGDDLYDGPSLSLGNNKSLSEVKEKAMRLEIENNNLKAQLGLDKSAVIGASIPSKSPDTSKLEKECEQLKRDLEKKEAEYKKLSSDKDKLESYTKKTLAKFQEKYLVALQECKSKLKDKHDKIEALEARSSAEKTAQKREEKLLSTVIYELGLTILQQRLKER